MPAEIARQKKSTFKARPDCPPERDINILLLGLTGVGKTTFINAFANYIVNNTLADAVNDEVRVIIPSSFSFTDADTFNERMIVIGEEDEYENITDGTQTGTPLCQSYVFPIGNRNLRFIDTPPVGDTRGLEQDLKNFHHILTYIAQYQHLNGVCILLKPNEQRLNLLFRFCVNELLRHLHVDAKENLIFVFTNARSTFFMPGSTKKFLQELLDKHRKEFNIDVPFSMTNTFLFDNEPFRYLALCKSGIQLDNEQTQSYTKSWDHSVTEIGRLMEHIVTRPLHATSDTLLLNEVEQLVRKLSYSLAETTKLIEENIQLAKEYKKNVLSNRRTKLLSPSDIDKRIGDLRDEERKIQDVYKKLARFLRANAILPINDGYVDYLQYFLREEQMKYNAGAQNTEVIAQLERMMTDHNNEMEPFKRTLQAQRDSDDETETRPTEEVFTLVGTLYHLPINGQQIRAQVEGIIISQEKYAAKRENFVELPGKAASSKLMFQLKDIVSSR